MGARFVLEKIVPLRVLVDGPLNGVPLLRSSVGVPQKRCRASSDNCNTRYEVQTVRGNYSDGQRLI